MITAEQYLERVRAATKAKESDENYYTIDLALRILSNKWDISRAMENIEAKRELYDMLPASHPMFLKLPGWALFFELGEAKVALDDDNLMDSFIYDRTTGIVILNISRGGHESFTAGLYQLYTPEFLGFRSMKEDDRNAEQFIEEGMGIVLSSRASRPMKSKNLRLTAQEKIVFSRFTFRDIE